MLVFCWLSCVGVCVQIWFFLSVRVQMFVPVDVGRCTKFFAYIHQGIHFLHLVATLTGVMQEAFDRVLESQPSFFRSAPSQAGRDLLDRMDFPALQAAYVQLTTPFALAVSNPSKATSSGPSSSPGTAQQKASKSVEQAVNALEDFFSAAPQECFPVLVLPVASVLPFPHDKGQKRSPIRLLVQRWNQQQGVDVEEEDHMPYWKALIGYTSPLSILPFPIVTVPVGTTQEGLPVGVQIVGPRGSDTQLLWACSRLQQHLGQIDAPCLDVLRQKLQDNVQSLQDLGWVAPPSFCVDPPPFSWSAKL